MGQATVDLPDPLEPPPVSAANTDELLAQLAGEEIDRLLADEEGGASPKPAAAAPLELAELASSLDAADALPVAAAEPATGPSVAPAPGSSEADAGSSASAELDDLLAKLGASTSAEAIPPAASAPAEAAVAPVASEQGGKAAVSPAAEPAAAAPDQSDSFEDGATSAAERGALNTSKPPAVSAAVMEIAAVAAAADDEPPLPVYLRLLEWINAPLAACPDHVREVIGKIALLTTVNALSILFYVFFLRHH